METRFPGQVPVTWASKDPVKALRLLRKWLLNLQLEPLWNMV